MTFADWRDKEDDDVDCECRMGVVMETSHNPSVKFRFPVKMRFSSLYTCREVLSRYTLQSSLQSCPRESGDALDKCGITWARVAFDDKFVESRGR